MVIWAAIPILVLSTLASGPFRDSMPAFVDTLASLAAMLSLFIWSVRLRPEEAAATAVNNPASIRH